MTAVCHISGLKLHAQINLVLYSIVMVIYVFLLNYKELWIHHSWFKPYIRVEAVNWGEA